MKIKKYIVNFLNKALAPFKRNSKIDSRVYSNVLLKIAGRNTYIETLTDKADSFHRRVENSYEESIINSFTKLISKLVKHTKLTKVKLAIDITDEDFYGKTSNLWIHGWTGEKGVRGKFKYIVLSRVDEFKIPIMALPFYVGMNISKAINFLLELARRLFRSISVVLFDRGFYSGKIIQLLENLRVNYLMFIPKNKAINRYLEEMRGFSSREAEHEIKWNANKTMNKIKTKLVLIKNFIGKNNKIYDWCFATNLSFAFANEYIFLYKKRWQIETNFRVEDEAKIKSKSANYMVRYFYFMFSLLLHALWLIFGKKIQFKRFIYELENLFGFELIGLRHVSVV
ncbi:transposase [Candidatus Woesearchaeota archaeon]|nr:transposase [Candidatus Woesearchaeota archaeon]